MPENDESRAKLMAQKVIALKQPTAEPIEPPGIQETPEDRQKRFAARVEEGETPDQRTARYLEKARRAGYMTQSPASPVLRNDVAGPPVDIELDAPPAPPTRYGQAQQVAAEASQGPGIVGRAQAWLDRIHKGSPEEDERIRTFIRHTVSPLTYTENGLERRAAVEARDAQDAEIAANQQKIEIIKRAQQNVNK